MKPKIETMLSVLFVITVAIICIPINIVLYIVEFLMMPFKRNVQPQKVHTWDEEVNKISMKF